MSTVNESRQIRLRITTDRSSQFIVLRQKKDNTNYEMTKRLDHTKYEILHLFFFVYLIYGEEFLKIFWDPRYDVTIEITISDRHLHKNHLCTFKG
jgi:hypothetical protein